MPQPISCSSGASGVRGEGHEGIVRRLLQAGANPHSTVKANGDGTPLQLAAVYGHLECVQELVRAGAVVEALDTGGNCAADYAEQYGHAKVLEYLGPIPRNPT